MVIGKVLTVKMQIMGDFLDGKVKANSFWWLETPQD